MGEDQARVSLPFERIDAVDGAQLSTLQKYLHYSPQLNKQQYHYPLSNGQIGCYLSHRKAWQKIVDEKLKYAIVLGRVDLCGMKNKQHEDKV